MQTRSLKCVLTPKQLEERGAALAEKVHALSALEADKRGSAATYKQQIEELEDEMAGLAREVSERAEYRQVEVTQERADGVETTIRQDTGEVVKTRVLRPDEMQGELKLMRPGRETYGQLADDLIDGAKKRSSKAAE